MNPKPRILIASPRLQSLADEVCRLNPEIQLQPVSWRSFPDTFPNTFVHNASGLTNAHVGFLMSCDTPAVIFEQVSFMYQLAQIRPLSLEVFMPYYPTGTMERVDDIGQVPTAWTLAQMLSAIAPAGPGSVPLHIWDIHALPNRHFFGPNIAPVFHSGVKLLRKHLEKSGKRVSIVLPDEGSYKRFKRMFLIDAADETKGYAFPLIICRKERGPNGASKVVVSEGEVKGCDVIIVDDLVHSGKTQILCKDAMFEAGANSVSAYATHGVFDLDSEIGVAGAGFSRFYITESVPKASKLIGTGPFTGLSIAPKIVEVMMK